MKKRTKIRSCLNLALFRIENLIPATGKKNTRQKLISVLGSPSPVLGMKVKQGESVSWLFFTINLSTSMSIKRSRRELSIDMIIQRGIFKNNQIKLFPCFTFIPTSIRVPKTGVSFYYDEHFLSEIKITKND